MRKKSSAPERCLKKSSKNFFHPNLTKLGYPLGIYLRTNHAKKFWNRTRGSGDRGVQRVRNYFAAWDKPTILVFTDLGAAVLNYRYGKVPIITAVFTLFLPRAIFEESFQTFFAEREWIYFCSAAAAAPVSGRPLAELTGAVIQKDQLTLLSHCWHK